MLQEEYIDYAFGLGHLNDFIRIGMTRWNGWWE